MKIIKPRRGERGGSVPETRKLYLKKNYFKDGRIPRAFSSKKNQYSHEYSLCRYTFLMWIFRVKITINFRRNSKSTRVIIIESVAITKRAASYHNIYFTPGYCVILRQRTNNRTLLVFITKMCGIVCRPSRRVIILLLFFFF